MQEALDALKIAEMDGNCYYKATDLLRTRLAQPEQEPVAVWELQEDGWDTICDGDWLQTLPVGTKLYTTPPAAAQPDRVRELKCVIADLTAECKELRAAAQRPLTDEQISALSKGHITRNGFARAIEAAHGIKENT